MDQTEILETAATPVEVRPLKQGFTAGFLVAVAVAMIGWLIALSWAVVRLTKNLFF